MITENNQDLREIPAFDFDPCTLLCNLQEPKSISMSRSMPQEEGVWRNSVNTQASPQQQLHHQPEVGSRASHLRRRKVLMVHGSITDDDPAQRRPAQVSLLTLNQDAREIHKGAEPVRGVYQWREGVRQSQNNNGPQPGEQGRSGQDAGESKRVQRAKEFITTKAQRQRTPSTMRPMIKLTARCPVAV